MDPSLSLDEMAVRVALESASVMLVMLLDAVEAAMPQQYRTPSNWKNEWGFIYSAH
jgi:hypothetical protein